jgi:putative CocE/NonD family hydrolase
MRDGTKLSADVYRPKAEGKFPVLVERDAYDRRGSADLGVRGATHGYVVVLQDVRGRHESEGEWNPLKHDADDGYDTVEWAASLPFSDGRVGMLGASYSGSCALLAAVARPPHLVAIHPSLTPSSPDEGLPYLHGVFQLWWADTWSGFASYDALARGNHAQTTPAEWAKKLPVSAYPAFDAISSAALAPYFRDWITHPTYGDYWRPSSIEEHYDAISTPAYHVGGWYDVFLRGTLHNYVGLRAHAATEAARRGQRLLIGPWNHIDSPGEVPFGESAERDFAELHWFDYAIKGLATEFARDKPVQIFVMGKNAWRGEDEWPLARAKPTRYHLQAGGALSEQAPANGPPDSFVYDPRNPVPTRGGGVAGGPGLSAGPLDQRPVESRSDVLGYTRRLSITTSRSPDLSRSISS